MNYNEKEKLVWEFKNQRITLDELVELSYNKGKNCVIEECDIADYDAGWDDGMRLSVLFQY